MAKSLQEKMAESASLYYPGCRKDANCTCEICIASINATLDLLPQSSSSSRSLQKSSITFSPAPPPKKKPFTSPKPLALSPITPPLHSTAKSRPPPPQQKRRKSLDRRYLTILPLIIAVFCGFALLKKQILGKSILSPDFIQVAGERAEREDNLRQKLLSVENYVAETVGAARVSNCSGGSGWEFQRDGRLITSKCVIFVSKTEEVSVWGFPTEISRVITTGFSSRWLAVLTGRLTEWSREKLEFEELRPGGYYRRWETGVLHLERETWVLEYKASWLENWAEVIPRLGQLVREKVPLSWRSDESLNYVEDVDVMMIPS